MLLPEQTELIKTLKRRKVAFAALFGSRAKGNYKKNSDYDFMVVKSGVKNEREISRRIYRALFDNHIRVPVDIIVVDSDKLDKNKENRYLIYSWALKEGEIVYG